MKSLMSLVGLGLILALAGCEEPSSRTVETDVAIDPPVAESAEDQATPAADAAAPATTQPPVDESSLPPVNPSSVESVQPESVTLFY